MSDKDLYGLIGESLGHSLSKEFFSEYFVKHDINADYRLFELPDIGDLMELLSEHPEIKGLNVTIPYKSLVIPYLDYIHPVAKEIGAVNTLKIDQCNGQPLLLGYNTDVIGIEASIPPIKFSNALVLGTGGASKAVAHVLKNANTTYTLVSRTRQDNTICYDDLSNNSIGNFDLIINATPLGTYPDTSSCPPIPYDGVNPHSLCLDLVYNPAVTLFMSRCASRGAMVKNGLEMLHSQALASWNIWTGTSED